jgi:hypothetical protein
MCGSQLPASPPSSGKCPNCNCDYSQCATRQGMQQNRPDPRGKQYNPFSMDNPMAIPHNQALASEDVLYDSHSKKIIVLSKTKTQKEIQKELEEQEEIFEDEKTFKSEEFKQLSDPFDKRNTNSDNDIEQTCDDLEILG